MTETLATSSPALPRAATARALVEAMLPAGERLPAADADQRCDTLARYVAERPRWRRLLSTTLRGLERRARLSHGRGFSQLSLTEREALLKHLAGTLISGPLLRARAIPFKAAWLLDDETQ